MLEKFEAYFRAIEMSETLQQRAEQVCMGFRAFIPAEIDRVFVTDGYDEAGVRRYQNLWLASGNLVMESKRFVTLDNIDFAWLETRIRYMEIQKTELSDINGETTIKSRLTVNLVLGLGMATAGRSEAALEAAHNNCLHLAEFVRLVFLPRLIVDAGRSN